MTGVLTFSSSIDVTVGIVSQEMLGTVPSGSVLYQGTEDIAVVYVGSTGITKIYLGSTQVFG
jgi:hypothetical protein